MARVKHVPKGEEYIRVVLWRKMLMTCASGIIEVYAARMKFLIERAKMPFSACPL